MKLMVNFYQHEQSFQWFPKKKKDQTLEENKNRDLNKQIKATWRKQRLQEKKKTLQNYTCLLTYDHDLLGTKQLGIQTSLKLLSDTGQQDCLSHLSPGFGFLFYKDQF